MSVVSSQSLLLARIFCTNRGKDYDRDKSSALQCIMLSPTGLLRNWQEEQPSYQGDIDSSITRKVGQVHYARGNRFWSDISTLAHDYFFGLLERWNSYTDPYNVKFILYIFLGLLEIKVFELNARRYRIYCVGFEVTSCSQYVNRRFGGKYHLHSQGRTSAEQETSVARLSV
jgi:hypothetical protein